MSSQLPPLPGRSPGWEPQPGHRRGEADWTTATGRPRWGGSHEAAQDDTIGSYIVDALIAQSTDSKTPDSVAYIP